MERYEVRRFSARQFVDEEIAGKRSWIVVSDQRTNDNGIAIVVATRSSKRSGIDAKPPFPEPRRFDAQQLWTFPDERDITVTSGWPVRELVSSSIARLRGALAGRLTLDSSAIATDRLSEVGRVLFVRLEPPTRDGGYADGDFTALRRTLHARAGISWPGNPELLPCIVVANRYGKARGSGFRLVTVVPLVEAPAFQSRFPENPAVSTADGSTSLSALSQCLLSVSCREDTNRLRLSSGGLDSWIATRDELRQIVEDVAQWLEVTAHVP